jgi:PAS domain S-box-containing protein
VPESIADLAGLKVGGEVLLAAVLEAAVQPIWVVGPDGVIRFANRAAIAALGYDRADELFGRHSHDTIHHKHPDGTQHPAADCPLLLPRVTGETVSSDLDWFLRRDGSRFPVSYVSAPIEMPGGCGAVVAFADIGDRVRAERVRREQDAVLEPDDASRVRVGAGPAFGCDRGRNPRLSRAAVACALSLVRSGSDASASAQPMRSMSCDEKCGSFRSAALTPL